MNLDDFILPNSVSSPAGISRSPSADPSRPSHNQLLPFKKRFDLKDHDLHPGRASAPSHPPINDIRRSEFGYVPKRVRKTSVDERMVRDYPS